MIFNSMAFLIFISVITILYYVIPHKIRWVLLLIASCYFYMYWRAEFIFLIAFTAFLNYACAGLIFACDNKKRRKIYLILCIIINLAVLFIFKYLVFINHSFMWLYGILGMKYPINDFSIVLPMGISFYTFQAMSYTIDVYREKYEPEHNFFKLMLFVVFFPQLTAGPIERADTLLNQLFTPKKLNVNNISKGLKFILTGFFKKLVIADRAAVLVDTVYNSPSDFGSISYILATVFFAFQIYCDFSGYSDLAVGSAKLLGIDLMQNFNKPYFAKGIKDFWRRWHISLSTWFRDYLYIPLGGNRVSSFRHNLNIIITFAVSGLWHGANWTFILWGLLHGFYQVVGALKDKLFFGHKPNKYFPINLISIVATFVLVCFAWIFFRANSISDAFLIVKGIYPDILNCTNKQYIYESLNNMGLSLFEIAAVFGAIVFLVFCELISWKKSVYELFEKLPFVLRFAYYYVITAAIIGLGVFGGGGEFIYFQF